MIGLPCRRGKRHFTMARTLMVPGPVCLGLLFQLVLYILTLVSGLSFQPQPFPQRYYPTNINIQIQAIQHRSSSFNATQQNRRTLEDRQEYPYFPHIPYYPPAPSAGGDQYDFLADSDEPLRLTYQPDESCEGDGRCQFLLACWLKGGKVGSGCGPLYSCCHSGSQVEKRRPAVETIQSAYYGPVRNDPSCGRSVARISRIVGGHDAAFGQFPWQAFIQVGGSRCGGALVGRQHVVTAGHCVAKSRYTPEKVRVTLGDYVLFSDVESLPHEVFLVAEVRLHPNFRFTPQADRYDVAVLILERPVQYRENIKPICLPPKGADFLGQVAHVAGWGAMQAGSKYRPKVLQFVPVQVVANEVCEMWHQRKGIDIQIHHEMMCAGYEYGGRDSCQGDSGGPLMLEHSGLWYLIGVVSAGYSCAKHHQPGIYHRISSSSDWVSANLF